MNNKQKIIKAYLLGENSFRQLGEKYGVGKTSIHRWVREFRGQSVLLTPTLKAVNLPVMKKLQKDKGLSSDVAALQKELEQERLRVKLLTAMIDIAEEELKI